jgi:fucose permease
LTIKIQAYYHIGYAVVSIIFLIQIVGYGTSSFMGNYFHTKLGRHKLAVIGGLMQCICYSLVCWAPPFPVMVCFPLGALTDRWWDTFSLVLQAGFSKLCTKINVNVPDVD